MTRVNRPIKSHQRLGGVWLQCTLTRDKLDVKQVQGLALPVVFTSHINCMQTIFAEGHGADHRKDSVLQVIRHKANEV